MKFANTSKRTYLRGCHIGLALLAVGLLSPSAHAQYKWKDQRGITVYSDTPPPDNTPNTLISPGGTRENSHKNHPATAPETTVTTSPTDQNALSSKANAAKVNAANAAANAANAGPKSLAEQMVDFNRRREEAEKKAATEKTESELSHQRSEDCERMKSYQRSLTQGQRIMRTKPNGEREFLTDKQQAEETTKINQSVSQQCNA